MDAYTRWVEENDRRFRDTYNRPGQPNGNNEPHTYQYVARQDAVGQPATRTAAPNYCQPPSHAYYGQDIYACHLWHQSGYYPGAQAYQYHPSGYYYGHQTPLAPAYNMTPMQTHMPQHNGDATSRAHQFVGRTPNEVRADEHRVATREGAFNDHNIEPENPTPDQMFWAIDTEGEFVCRNYYTIVNTMQPGKWHKDPNHGHLYFVQKKENK